MAWRLVWSGPGWVQPCGRWRAIPMRVRCSRRTGLTQNDLPMCGPSDRTTLGSSTSSVAGSRVRISPPRARVLAFKVLAVASGSSSTESLQSFVLRGSLSRMLPVAQHDGSTPSYEGWNSLGMRVFRSRLLQVMLEHRTGDSGSSLLPTLLARDCETSVGARPRQGAPPLRELLPTLGTWDYAPGRQGFPRVLQLLPTLCSRDAKGIGPKHTKGGQDLPRTLGGNLNANWCRWYMGFPPGWLDVLDESRFGSLEIASSPNAPKSSAG